jgi:hypothetical protein
MGWRIWTTRSLVAALVGLRVESRSIVQTPLVPLSHSLDSVVSVHWKRSTWYVRSGPERKQFLSKLVVGVRAV